jgi:hypothetical protein
MRQHTAEACHARPRTVAKGRGGGYNRRFVAVNRKEAGLYANFQGHRLLGPDL